MEKQAKIRLMIFGKNIQAGWMIFGGTHNGCSLGVVFMAIDNLLMGKIAVTWLGNQQEKMNRKKKKSSRFMSH